MATLKSQRLCLSDMFGRTAMDLATTTRGQPVRITDGESFEEARVKSEILYSLMSDYATRYHTR
jgi:hypothetical protein